MDLRGRMWIQIGGAVLLMALAIAEMTGLKGPTFDASWGSWVLMGGAAVMLFEAWRTRRMMKTLPSGAATTADDSGLKRDESEKTAI